MKYMLNGREWVEQIKALILIVLISIFPITTRAQLIAPSEWESELYSDHNLVGMIWSSATNIFISKEQLSRDVLSAKYLILGEKHDNPDHHLVQLGFINYLLDNNKLEQITFEMMDGSSQSLLDAIQNEQFSSLDELRNYLEWDEVGWDWDFYGPLLNAAYIENIPMAAGNITNEEMLEVYGFDSLPNEYNVLDDATMEQLFVDIDESHCGLLPESQFPAMVRVQQARDYSMASSMPEPEDEGAVVLITGNYHARKDLGVANYLVSKHHNLSMGDIVSIGLIEVQESEENPEFYLQKYGDVAAYDYIWFTPAISEEDYCATLRQ